MKTSLEEWSVHRYVKYHEINNMIGVNKYDVMLLETRNLRCTVLSWMGKFGHFSAKPTTILGFGQGLKKWETHRCQRIDWVTYGSLNCLCEKWHLSL